ncbi:MAG: Ig-like domain-containing protein [Bacteroidales bacterium]|nr:Ig-like domain-containing protein [Bacteroidales bacterium]
MNGSVLTAYSQTIDLTGYKIFINPGHGGYDPNDRHIPATGFWESEGNLVKGLFLRELLESLNAMVYMSRTANTTADDLSLSVIDEMANAANADFFLSIHSNGFDGTQNYPLLLFRGYDNQPVFPEAKSMAQIMWQKLFEKGNCWTSSNHYVKGDWTFYPEWGDQTGLGVLRTLTMPGVLSEGSFHDYIPESWRLRNDDHLHHESWAFLRAFIEFYDVMPLDHGIVAGVIRDTLLTPAWYFRRGTRDEKLPVNGTRVILTPGNRIYQVDDLNNGFFFFDSLSPGEYKLYFDGPAGYTKDSLPVSVIPNATALADIYLQTDTTKAPEILGIIPDLSDSIPVNQEFTFTFSMPMDPDSVQKAIEFNPEALLNYQWDDDYRTLKLWPSAGLTSKTAYSIIVATAACSRWKVNIAAEQQYSFVTLNRSRLSIEKTYPSDGQTGVTLYPQIRIYFDAPVNEMSASSEIQLVNEGTGQPLTKVRERFIIARGKGAYYFETEQQLEPGKQYTVALYKGLTDAGGFSPGKDYEFSFITRSTIYKTGIVIEPYEEISKFRDPETSGSTAGTNNELTTFTLSSDVKFSGSGAGQLDYVFTGDAGGICRVFDTQKPSLGNNDSSVFGIWVFGDLSCNILEYWFYADGSVNQAVFVDEIDWAGWDYKAVPLNIIPADGEILFHSMVIRQANGGLTGGTIWFDDASLYTPPEIEEPGIEDITVEFRPNPLTGTGIIKCMLPENSVVSVRVYSPDGRVLEIMDNICLDKGVREILWKPSPALANGIYLIDIKIRPFTGVSRETITRRWVLAR